MSSELERFSAFLSLCDFEEYMERLEEFIGLPLKNAAFRKEQSLMETDSSHTHRQKDAIRRGRIREIVRKLHSEINQLCDAVIRNGCYVPPEETERQSVEICYLFPDGKNGDINHAIAGICAETVEIEGDTVRAVFSGSEFAENIEPLLHET